MSENEDLQSERTEEQSSENSVDIKKRKRGNVWGFILTIVIIACVLFALWQLGSVLQDGDSATFIELMESMNGWYLLAAVGVLVVIMISDVLKYTLLNNTFDCKIGILRDAKLGLTGKYYECITPTGTGGQPMQIYYLCKNGVSGSKSSSVVMMKYAVQMTAAAIVGAVVMGAWGYKIYETITDGTISNGIYIGGWVGFAINACAPVFIVFVVFCPGFLKWLINLGLVLLNKMRIIKNLDAARDKSFKGIDNFAVCSQFIFTHPLRFFELLLLCLVEPVCLCIIPYFVLKALCGAQVAEMSDLMITVAALTMFSTYSVVYVPTPGTSGAVETVFMLAFASISGDVLFWVVLVWRFITFYIYIVMGIGMNIWDVIAAAIKKRRERNEQQALPAEEENGGNEE